MEKIMFKDLNLSSTTLSAIEEKWFVHPTDIQAQVIPIFLDTDKDIIGQANTWTWKTAAFGLPLIEKIDDKSKKTQAIIMTPTRELAIQVAKELKSFLWKRRVNISLIYWGQNIGIELGNLERWAQIVVWTPWRIQDHLRRWSLKINEIKYFILDEADEMLKIGFRDEIDEILRLTPAEKRTLLFSATLPKEILRIVDKYMKNYAKISVEAWNVKNELIDEYHFAVKREDKFEALIRIIEASEDFYGIVFCRTKRDVDEIVLELERRNFAARWVHGDVEQRKREKILAIFKERKCNILVATDVAARWIDIKWLTNVVNFSLPENPEVYTHRVWRTWRAGQEWEAVSLVSRWDYRLLLEIERFTSHKIEKRQLPSIWEIKEIKHKNIIEKISKKSEERKEFLDFAEKILENQEPQQALANMLSIAFEKEIIPNTREIDENTRLTQWGRNGSIRLFVWKWRGQNVNKNALLDILNEATNLRLSDMQNIAILDKFSYVNVPKVQWEMVIKHFKKSNYRKPLVVKAKERR